MLILAVKTRNATTKRKALKQTRPSNTHNRETNPKALLLLEAPQIITPTKQGLGLVREIWLRSQAIEGRGIWGLSERAESVGGGMRGAAREREREKGDLRAAD
jgi:hypothetical protein